MSLSNATIHNVRLDSHFTITANITPEDSKLSWAAKGLLWYILSRSSDWQIHTSQLATIYQGKKKGGGLDAIKEIVKELRSAGYVKYTKLRNSKGEWHHRYDVYPIPHSDFQKIYPERDLPALGSPLVVNPSDLPRTDYTDDDDKGLKPPQEKNPSDLLITKDSKGRKVTSCKLKIIKYLKENNYPEEIIHEALKRTESTLDPISNPLKYVETICLQIQSQNSKKPQYNPKENPWTPRQSKFQRKRFYPKEAINPSKKQSTISKEKTMEEDTSAHPFQTWPSRLKTNKQQLTT